MGDLPKKTIESKTKDRFIYRHFMELTQRIADNGSFQVMALLTLVSKLELVQRFAAKLVTHMMLIISLYWAGLLSNHEE